MFWVLSKTFEMHNEWMVQLCVNKVLVVHMIYLLRFDDLPFVQKFEGDVFSCLLILGNFDFTESTWVKMKGVPLPRILPIS